jgi:hypothetical protein
MYKDKEVKNVKNFFVNVWRKSIFDIYVTEYGTALTTIFFFIFIHFHYMKMHRLLFFLQRRNIFRQDIGIGI